MTESELQFTELAERDQIKDYELQMVELEKQKKDVDDGLKNIEKEANEYALQRAEMKDKEYSNEKKRALKVDEMLENNGEYQSLKDRQWDIKIQMKKTQIEIDFLKRQFKREMGTDATTAEIAKLGEYMSMIHNELANVNSCGLNVNQK